MSLLKIIYFFVIINQVFGANILMVYQIFGTSHFILGSSIAKALIKVGHEVTFVSPFEIKDPPQGPGKLNSVVLKGILEEKNSNDKFKNLFESRNIHPIRTLFWMNYLGNTLTEKTLSHPNFQKLIHSSQKFDLIIIEQFCNDALKALAPHFNAPLVLVSSLGANTWLNDLVANPAPPSYVLELLLNFRIPMSFSERLTNTIHRIASVLNHHLLFYPSQKKLMEKYFPEAPNFYNVLYNTSLVLLNSHISTHQTKPHVPAMIEVGGFHVQPPKNLTGEIKEFMDSSKEGVIYFSMGSTLKASDMPEHTRKDILNALSKVSEKVLWKWENDNLPDQPPNVKIAKWLPQQDILAHPNTKLFITHGGLLSTTETIYHGVPVLSLPVFGDQKLNAAQSETSGFGLTIDFYKITEEKLTSALDKLLHDPNYSKNAKVRSKLFHDRLIKPMDSVIYWIEYVIRHKGAEHLRVAGLDLVWYQYLLIDVFLVLFAIILFTSILAVIISKVFSKIIFNIRERKLKDK